MKDTDSQYFYSHPITGHPISRCVSDRGNFDYSEPQTIPTAGYDA